MTHLTVIPKKTDPRLGIEKITKDKKRIQIVTSDERFVHMILISGA